MGQYGDVSVFTLPEKQALLQSLEQVASEYGLDFGAAAGMRGLAVPDMVGAFERVLTSGGRARRDQFFAEFLLEVLREAPPLPGLAEVFLGVVRDRTWWSSVRTAALRALASAGGTVPDLLKDLLAKTRDGRVPDADYELRGTLLELLYPQHLSVTELWSCFSDEYDPHLYGAYRRFWEKLARKSPDDHVAEHLDYLSEAPPNSHGDNGGDGRRSATLVYSDPFRRLRLALVARGLSRHGDDLVSIGDIVRLYDWLGVASAKDGDGWGTTRKSIAAIRSWLEDRPQVQKVVLLEGLRRCPDEQRVEKCVLSVRERLYGCRLSLQEAANDWERLRIMLERPMIREPSPDVDEWQEWEERYRAGRAQEKEKELDVLRSQRTPLLENRASPGLLDQLARIYFADFGEIADDREAGARAIDNRFSGDQSVANAVLVALRDACFRDDIPSVKDVARACRGGRCHHLALPFLAGLAERERAGEPIPFGGRDGETGRVQDGQAGGNAADAGDLARVAVAFFFAANPGRYLPDWYRRIVDERPELVAGVQARVAAAAIKGNPFADCKLDELAYDPHYAEVARRSALPVLRGFPVRCGRDRARALGHVLHAALMHCDGDALLRLIEAKLSRSSMSVWQRTYWLAAGLFVVPNAYAESLREQVRGHEYRLSELSGFFGSRLLNSLPGESIAHLVRLLGGSVQPERYMGVPDRIVVHDVPRRTRVVRDLIGRLAASHSSEAGELLRGLLRDESLSDWNEELMRAWEAQRVMRRDHGYQHPGVEDVCAALREGRPANVAPEG